MAPLPPKGDRVTPVSLPVAAPLRGVLLLAAAVLLFALMDTTNKYLTASFAVPLVVAMRYLVNLALLMVFVAPRQGKRLYQTKRTGLVLLRSASLVVASFFMGLALQRMPVAECTAIIFLAPLLLVLVAGPLLGERPGLVGWTAALAGFAGVLLIVRPDSGLDPVGLACLCVTTTCTVVYNLLSRVLARTESTMAMLFYSALVGAVAFGAYLPWSIGQVLPTLWQWALLLSLGVTGGIGHFLFTTAFRHAPVSVLAPVNYLQLVWAGLLGWLVFGHVPDSLTLTGMAVVSAAGVAVALNATRKRPAPVIAAEP